MPRAIGRTGNSAWSPGSCALRVGCAGYCRAAAAIALLPPSPANWPHWPPRCPEATTVPPAAAWTASSVARKKAGDSPQRKLQGTGERRTRSRIGVTNPHVHWPGGMEKLRRLHKECRNCRCCLHAVRIPVFVLLASIFDSSHPSVKSNTLHRAARSRTGETMRRPLLAFLLSLLAGCTAQQRRSNYTAASVASVSTVPPVGVVFVA